MILILGAGLSGLSASYHFGHDRCLILERDARPFGHIRSTRREGFTWDTGPHVSFTKHEYVRELFRASVDEQFDEYEVRVANYFKGSWIAHPAQTSLWQVPEPLRSECLASFLATRENLPASLGTDATYAEWLERAFGPVFAKTFPAAYTRKYWTREAAELTTGWIGNRIHYPDVDEVLRGSKGPLPRSTHYINKVRYPRAGGYEAFAAKLRDGSNIRFGCEVKAIDLRSKTVWLADGSSVRYTQLVNTLPLPVFVNACIDAPPDVKAKARGLSCTQLLLVNVAAPHTTRRPENWLYVYDEDKYTTRVNCTELLTPGNAPTGWTGVQAEVYFSRHRPLARAPDDIAAAVQDELVEMGLVDPSAFAPGFSSHRHVSLSPWANVVFDQETAPALDVIWTWLASHGLRREADDLSPVTDWDGSEAGVVAPGEISMAGRFGQWKYYWSDDCVLRGRRLARP